MPLAHPHPSWANNRSEVILVSADKRPTRCPRIHNAEPCQIQWMLADGGL